MEGLELPDTGESYDNIPDASEGLEDTKAERPSMTGADDLSDIEMPVFSEMDGSVITAPEKKPEKSVGSDMSEKPVFEEMAGAAAAQISSSYSPADSSQNRKTEGTYYSGGSYQNTSAPSYAESFRQTSDNTSSYSSQSQDNTYFSNLDSMRSQQMEMASKGRSRAKFVGIFSIVLDVLETLFMLSLRNIIVTVMRTVFAVKFIKGSDSSRKLTGYFAVLRIIMNIISIAQVDSLTHDFAEYGLSIIITITQLILFFGIAVNCVVIYFTLFDKCVKEYTVEK